MIGQGDGKKKENPDNFEQIPQYWILVGYRYFHKILSQ